MVKPGLANGDDAGLVEKVTNGFRSMPSFVWVEADRGVHRRVSRGDVESQTTGGAITSNDDHRFNPAGLGGFERADDPTGDSVVVDMAVRIDPEVTALFDGHVNS
jgi:hypothetical protein